MENDSQLITAVELQSRMDDTNVRIVDCRFDLGDPSAGRRAYRDAHIAGSVFADLNEDLSAPISPESGRHPLPDIDKLAHTFGRLGIGETTDVVVYDTNNGAFAARMWWLLRWLGHQRVQLLDGGYEQWLSSSGQVRGGDEQAAAQLFAPRPCQDKVLTTDEIASDLDAIVDMRLFDARDAARFRGDVEPIDSVAGHIPGARNLPFQSSLHKDGTWKSSAELEAMWRAVIGQDKGRSSAVMCGSGVTACHLAISAVQAGYREPRLYVGSWSEWIRDPARPIGRGVGPNPLRRPADMT